MPKYNSESLESKYPRVRKRVGKKKPHILFDKYDLYLKSVQSPDVDVLFYRDTYKELKRKLPRVLREDFCGTFGLSCEWVKLNKNFESFALDIDPEPMAYGKAHNFKKLSSSQQKRVHVLEKNVLDKDLPRADIIVAMNFSYFVFKTRALMKAYFLNSLRSLRPGGIFIVDIFGGSQCFDANEDIHPNKKFTYYWDQTGFDPVTNRSVFHIHYRVGREKIKKVFSYDWRMWSIPEIRDILEEVGFSRTHVYWEGTTTKGEGDGKFTRTEHGEACLSWVAYIVAEK